MKTHDLARLLQNLARILKSAPNAEFETYFSEGGSRKKEPLAGEDPDVPVALGTMVALNKLDKAEWLKIIDLYSLNVDIRPRDATRDIIGKILNYLERNPKEIRRITALSSHGSPQPSPELLTAMNVILGRGAGSNGKNEG